MSMLENVSKAIAEKIRNDPELMEIVEGFGRIAEANDLSQEDQVNFCKLMYMMAIMGDKDIKEMMIADMENKIRNGGQAQ